MKRAVRQCLVLFLLAVMTMSTLFCAYAEDTGAVCFTVNVGCTYGGKVYLVDESTGESRLLASKQALSAEAGKNLTFRVEPDEFFVCSYMIDDTGYSPIDNTITLRNITSNHSLYISFVVSDNSFFKVYNKSYYNLSEYRMMSLELSRQVANAIGSYSTGDLIDMSARESISKGTEIMVRELFSGITDMSSYTDQQIDKMTDTFLQHYVDELTDDMGDSDDFGYPQLEVPEILTKVSDWSKYTETGLKSLFAVAFGSSTEDYAYAEGIISEMFKYPDKFKEYLDEALSFQEFVGQCVMIDHVNRSIVEELIAATDDSTMLYKGLVRRLDKMNNSTLDNLSDYIVDQKLPGILSSNFTSFMLDTASNFTPYIKAVKLMRSVIRTGLKCWEKQYNATTAGDYVISAYSIDSQMFFAEKISDFIDSGSTSLSKLETLIRAYSAATKTVADNGASVISKTKLDNYDELIYKFNVYKKWALSDACRWRTYFDQLMDYAVARKGGAAAGYKPASVYYYPLSLSSDNLTLNKNSFKVGSDPEVTCYCNIALSFRSDSDMTVTVNNKSYNSEVVIDYIKIGEHNLTYNGDAIFYNTDGINILYDGSVVVNGNVRLKSWIQGGKIVVNGDVKSAPGGIISSDCTINGNLYGYDTDKDGNIVPGGYLKTSGKITITGDCYLDNANYACTEYSSTGGPTVVFFKGTLELKGNLYNLSDKKVYAEHTFNILFSGNEVQKVVSVNGGSFDLRNVTSTGKGIDFSEAGHVRLAFKSDANIYGNKMDCYVTGTDQTISFMDPIEITGEWDFGSVRFNKGVTSRCSFTQLTSFYADGDLRLEEKSLMITGTGMTVNGNLYNYAVDENGNKTEGGMLLLYDGAARINGDCYLYNDYTSYMVNRYPLDHESLEITGDLINLSDIGVYFPSSMQVIFSGDKVHRVISEKEGGFTIHNMVINTAAGVDFSKSHSYVYADPDNYVLAENGKIAIFAKPRPAGFTGSVAGESVIAGGGFKLFIEPSKTLENEIKYANIKMTLDTAKYSKDKIAYFSDAETITLGGKKVYVFTFDVRPVNMTDKVSVDLMWGNTCMENLGSFSVQDCAQYVLNNRTTFAKEVPLAIATLNYGTEIQKYFGYKTDDLANSILQDSEKTTPELTAKSMLPYKFLLSDRDASINYAGYLISIDNNAAVSIRLQFNKADIDISSCRVAVGGKAVDPSRLSVENDGDKIGYLVIKNIRPGEFDQAFTVRVGDVALKNLSVYSYLRDAANPSSDNLSDLARAMYYYNEAVKAYAA